MRTVGAYEAKTKLSALLDLVSQGESVTITRHGLAIAVLMPVVEQVTLSPTEAVARMKQNRVGRSLGDLSIQELRESGRRF